MKVLVVLGTRPEVIKLAPLVKALRKQCDTVVCATGQHREMLKQALSSFSLFPDVSLEAMLPGQSLNMLSSRMLELLDNVLEEHEPDWVIVQGDTTTAFCAGLAAFHRGIRVAHIEAGLRTGNLNSPFPEEANRSLLSKIATLHFAPTDLAKDNLTREGVSSSSIIVSGNTVVDAILDVSGRWEDRPQDGLPKHVQEKILDRAFVLVTFHRRENQGTALHNVCTVLTRLCERYPQYLWVFPVHLNPNVRGPIRERLNGIPNLELIDPVDYSTSLYLIKCSALVISDSGGIQEEAPTFGTPLVVLREHTERVEGVSAGFAILAGTDPVSVEKAVSYWLDHPEARQLLKVKQNPYGDGHASERIVSSLLAKTDLKV